MDSADRITMGSICCGTALFIRVVYPQLNEDWFTNLATLVLWGTGGYNFGALIGLHKEEIKLFFSRKNKIK